MNKQEKIFIDFLKECKHFLKGIIDIGKVVGQPTYFPELKRKSKIERFTDNLKWCLKYHESNEFYSLYGLDLAGVKNPERYMDYYGFMKTREETNKSYTQYHQVGLLRDKWLFYEYMNMHNMNVPCVFARIMNGVIYDKNSDVVDVNYLKEREDYFIKDINGECASYIKRIKNFNEFMEVYPEIRDGAYIIQEKVIQSDAMGKLNPGSVNTLRIVTINKNGNPYLFAALLRVGNSKTGNVDNWAAGGLAVGIKEDGYLRECGLYKPKYAEKEIKHPDSGVIFSEYQIPGYEECVKAALDAHRLFYGVRSIGWDIAITDEGPCFIEGNDNWEISLLQGCNGPLRDKWEEAVRGEYH